MNIIYSLGADIGKDEFEVCLQRYRLTDQHSHVIARKTFKNKPSGFRACMKWAARHSKGAPLRCTMEATGVYYEALALHIQDQHRQVHLAVVLPSHSEAYRKSRGLRSKTDKIDAFGLSLMGAERNLPGWAGIDPFWRRLRTLTRTRTELVEQRTQLRNQLHALDHSGLVVEQAKQALQETIATLCEQIEQLTRRIYKQLRSRETLRKRIACIKSIYGVGLLTIACVLAETNGFERFSSISQLISFSGYDVLVRQSSKWSGTPKLSKQGSKYIRRAMYMPATTVVRSKQGPIWEFYQRLLSKHNVKMKAHVAVQKKLLRYMYILWNKQETFDPEHIRNLQAYHDNVAPSEDEATVDTSPAAA